VSSPEIDRKEWTARKLAWWDAVTLRKDLSEIDKLVAWRIATRDNPDNDGAWVGANTIAEEELGRGESTIRRSIAKLCRKRLILKVSVGGGRETSRHRPNYEMTLTAAPPRGGNGRWASQEERDAYAQRRIAETIGGAEGWVVVLAAEDPKNPHHREAVRKVRRVARQIEVGWVSPGRRAPQC
jgi:hypothetical protein